MCNHLLENSNWAALITCCIHPWVKCMLPLPFKPSSCLCSSLHTEFQVLPSIYCVCFELEITQTNFPLFITTTPTKVHRTCIPRCADKNSGVWSPKCPPFQSISSSALLSDTEALGRLPFPFNRRAFHLACSASCKPWNSLSMIILRVCPFSRRYRSMLL